MALKHRPKFRIVSEEEFLNFMANPSLSPLDKNSLLDRAVLVFGEGILAKVRQTNFNGELVMPTPHSPATIISSRFVTVLLLTVLVVLVVVATYTICVCQ